MDLFKNFGDTVIYIGLIIIIIIFIMLLLFRATLDPYFVFISTIANIVVILLMLITINLTNKSTRKQIESFESSMENQIESWERWDNIQRIQFIKSIIREFKANIEVYSLIAEHAQNGDYYPTFYDFLLDSIGKSLYNSPIDDKELNDNIITIYFILTNHNNRINHYRNSIITQDYESMVKGILIDYNENEALINSIIKRLELLIQ